MIPAPELAGLDARVEQALASGDQQALPVIGYGEVTLVVGWPPDEPRWACKRLPPFPGDAALAAYRAVLDRYLAELRARDVDVVPTELCVRERPDGSRVAYCVQPLLPASALLPSVLRAASPDREHPALRAIAATVAGAVDATVGLDAQLSNWAWLEGRLRYLDVTTPLLRAADGRPLLDVGLFLAALPWALRAPVARFVLPGVIDRYSRPRAVLLDLVANLVKERLTDWIPVALLVVNDYVAPPITAAEAQRAYASDARLWRALLALRRADRWWQRTVRRRPYPFLLPGPIARR